MIHLRSHEAFWTEKILLLTKRLLEFGNAHAHKAWFSLRHEHNTYMYISLSLLFLFSRLKPSEQKLLAGNQSQRRNFWNASSGAVP